MGEMSREAQLNSRLTECEHFYRAISNVSGVLESGNCSDIPEDHRSTFASAIACILRNISDVDNLLKDSTLDEPLQSIATKHLQFYRDKLAPNREHLKRLLMDLLAHPDVEIDRTKLGPEVRSTPVWNILCSGFDCWNTDDTDYSKHELQDTERLLFSPFFQPDEWLRNAAEIDPVLGKAADQRIPIHVRLRLKELYRSFILGNYLASVALARAILEYALVDRSNSIGINAYGDDPKYPNRTRRLRLLVEEASEKVSDLKDEMESILDAGNQALHPTKRDKVVRLPSALRALALTSVKAVRKVVESLYLE